MGFDGLAIWRDSTEWNLVKSAFTGIEILVGIKKSGSNMRFIDNSVIGGSGAFYGATWEYAGGSGGSGGNCFINRDANLGNLDDR